MSRIRMGYEYQVILERDFHGGYAVMCPAIPGCISQGNSIEEATNNIQDAIQLCIMDLRQRGEEIPLPSEVQVRIVTVAT